MEYNRLFTMLQALLAMAEINFQGDESTNDIPVSRSDSADTDEHREATLIPEIDLS